MKKAHVAKPTAPIKMPQYKVQKAAPMPKVHVAKAKAPAKSATGKSPTAEPRLKLPTIPQHREKLASMAGTPPAKKGKDS